MCLQFLHYSAVCVVLTWIVAWLLFVLVEVPVLTLLFHPVVKKVLFWPVVAYALAVVLVSVPATIFVHAMILKNVTPQIEHDIMFAPFA